MKDVEAVIYFEKYIVLDPWETDTQPQEVLTEGKYAKSRGVPRALQGDKEKQDLLRERFRVGMGAEAIRTLLAGWTCKALRGAPQGDGDTASEAKKKKISKRLKIVEAFRDSEQKPEWMSSRSSRSCRRTSGPGPLDGGRFATSDLNDLYRRVINRNNRLKRLLDLSAPEIIIRNEKRMLQEPLTPCSTTAAGKAHHGIEQAPLKSLSDMLKGKGGRFRQNSSGSASTIRAAR